MGSILALFRPSGPLCFPVRQGAFRASEEQQQQQEQQEGSMSHMSHCTTSGIKTSRKLLFLFSRVSERTLGSFWARFWRCSVLQGHCVSLSGRVRFQPREEEPQQQQEQQEGSMSHMSHCTTSGKKKLVENYCFSRVSEGTLGSFWARFWRCSVLQGHCVSLSGRVRFQLREEEQQHLCLIVQTVV